MIELAKMLSMQMVWMRSLTISQVHYKLTRARGQAGVVYEYYRSKILYVEPVLSIVNQLSGNQQYLPGSAHQKIMLPQHLMESTED
ncbi:hypothetical protein CS542_04975 [Pedobacter sp. IW39]|nr:hypothetical protein CS542_04975 [Pedobacter sp. IW39]